jgi:hypothetical protein
MMSGLSCVAPGLPGGAEGGLPRAALRLPKGVEEAVMLEVVEAEDISEVVRGGDVTRGESGAGGLDADGLGISGGEEGELRGD